MFKQCLSSVLHFEFKVIYLMSNYQLTTFI